MLVTDSSLLSMSIMDGWMDVSAGVSTYVLLRPSVSWLGLPAVQACGMQMHVRTLSPWLDPSNFIMYECNKSRTYDILCTYIVSVSALSY